MFQEKYSGGYYGLDLNVSKGPAVTGLELLGGGGKA